MTAWTPDEVWIERSEADSAVARRVRERLPDLPTHVVDDPSSANPYEFAAGKRRLVVQRHRGTFLQACPAGTSGLVCCNYLVMNFASNCPFDCTYCFLQDYLRNNSAIKIFSNPEDGLAEAAAVLRAHPERTFRIGTGELADSLALDPISGLSELLVPFFAAHANAMLELKTKSDCIESLLHLDPKGRVVVSWSMNTRAVTANDEAGTASFDARLAAARRVQAAGYKVGIHFDPLIDQPGWESAYREAIRDIFRAIDPKAVAWISLGSLRLGSGLKAAIRSRPTATTILDGELVPSPDGKDRVWRGVRIKMYRRLLDELRSVDSCLPLYVCMEPAGVWEKVFGNIPSDRQLADHLVGALA